MGKKAKISNNNNEHDVITNTMPSFNRPPPSSFTTNTNTTTTRTTVPTRSTTVTASTATTWATTISVVGGRLNILVMYFLRIILVFFFVWLPGMIMYYKAYETDRTSAGLLQNIGFFFFTLQAIGSGSMAMSKPDVRKAVYNLYNDIIQILFGGIMQCIKNWRQEQKEKEQQQQQEQQGQSSTTSPQSSSKSTVAKSSTGNTAVDIESGNDSDSNKSNDVNNEDYNNSNDLKEDVALARMIEETECDENDDVEAQSSSTEITFVEHTVLSNAII